MYNSPCTPRFTISGLSLGSYTGKLQACVLAYELVGPFKYKNKKIEAFSRAPSFSQILGKDSRDDWLWF